MYKDFKPNTNQIGECSYEEIVYSTPYTEDTYKGHKL